jgi:tetratricopeptide (TPR) repeat protein
LDNGEKLALKPANLAPAGKPIMQTNCYDGKNGVLQFILSEFDSASPHHGRFEGQINGNHFTQGITVYGLKQALVITLWANYERVPNNFADSNGKCWNTGDLNGYDLCEHVRAYMQKVGKPHLSLIEAIASGEVEELLCLQSEVGPADGFFSHVQAVAVATTVQSLEEAEKTYANELLEDLATIKALRRKALEDFLQATAPHALALSNQLLERPPADIEQWCYENFRRFPFVQAITAKKKHARCRFFVDYFNIRQCVKNDFATDRLVDAIGTIGVTVVELGADYRDDSALLKRIFCVLELFATIKTKGKLLVCGPILGDATAAKEMAEVAADEERCTEVMDSKSSRTRSPEAEAEIKAYIKRSVGFQRTDKIVLAAIVSGCMQGAEASFNELNDRGGSVQRAVGRMLTKVGDYVGAQVQLEAARAKEQAAGQNSTGNTQALLGFYTRHDASKATREHADLLLSSATVADIRVALQTKYGEVPPLSDTTFETADTVFLLGECHRFTDGVCLVWFEQSLRMDEETYGKEHVATARSLVGTAIGHINTSNDATMLAKVVELCQLAIARIEASDCPSDHVDTHAEALETIGVVHLKLATRNTMLAGREAAANEHWQECLKWNEQSARMWASKHGAATALINMAVAYKHLGEPEKGVALLLQIVALDETVQGPLSIEVSRTSSNLGSACQQLRRYSEGAGWFMRAAEAAGYTNGETHPDTIRNLWCLARLLQEVDPADTNTKECRQFLETSERARGRPLRIHCARGHLLNAFVNPAADDGCCDGCRNSIPQAADVFGCRQCNFDVCHCCI